MQDVQNFLSWLVWDPPREAFTVPYLNRPVMWYGIFFVLGFMIGYYIILPILRRKLEKNHPDQAKELSVYLAERLVWFTIIGGIVGARLGEIFFYDWPHYRDHPLNVFKVWEGGLASHGGAVGALIAVLLFHRLICKRFPEITLIGLLDMIVIPTAFVAFCIRIGNFFNQEIIGISSTVPWAIIFKHPADGSLPIPRHPTQLYEAFVYLATFIFLFTLWKVKGEHLKQGILSGLFFVIVFGSRFIIEFWKNPLSQMIDESRIHMGQYLSIPFILAGLILMIWKKQLQNSKT